MTHTVPVRCLISLMTFALGLSIALPSHAVTVAEAVAAARNTQLPDIDGIMANHDGVLDAVGGGSTEGLDDVKNLWADGKGTLTGSAEATVIECRGKTDTTCRAIQVLDKGFPERPVIGEDVLAGRDEIVNNPTVTPDDNGTCKDVTIEADPVEVTKTCRAGGWWNEKACRIGPVEIGKVTAKYFACAEGEGTSSERSCLTTVSGKPAFSVWTERCFFGKESSAASGTVTEETSAVARAIFSGVCTSTDATTETVKCSEVLESNNDHGCVLGDKTTARVNGERGAIVLGDVSNDVGTIFVIRDCGAGNLLPRANIRLIIAVTCSKRNEVGFLIFYILLIRDFSRLGFACCNRGNLQPIMARTFDITKRLFTNERITHIVRIRTAFEHDKH